MLKSDDSVFKAHFESFYVLGRIDLNRLLLKFDLFNRLRIFLSYRGNVLIVFEFENVLLIFSD